MVLVTDIVEEFVTGSLIPKIVAKSFEMFNAGSTEAEVIDEICSKELLGSAGAANTSSSTNATSSKPTAGRKAAVAKTPTVEPVDLEDFEEYQKKHDGEHICLYIFTKGKPKGKVCCRPIAEEVVGDDDKSYRCIGHKNGNPGPDIKTELAKLKGISSVTASRVNNVKSGLPRGAPVALAAKTETKSDKIETPVRSGLTTASSVRERLRAKENASANASSGSPSDRKVPSLVSTRDRKAVSPTPERSEATDRSEAAEPEETKSSSAHSVVSDRESSTKSKSTRRSRDLTPKKSSARSVSPSDRESEPEETKLADPAEHSEADPEETESPKPSESAAETEPTDGAEGYATKSVEEETKSESPVDSDLRDFEDNIPKDAEGELCVLKPSFASAKKFSWYLVSKRDAIVTSEDFSECYGVYTASDDIDPDKDLKINPAWKTSVKTLSSVQHKWVESMGAKTAKFSK